MRRMPIADPRLHLVRPHRRRQHVDIDHLVVREHRKIDRLVKCLDELPHLRLSHLAQARKGLVDPRHVAKPGADAIPITLQVVLQVLRRRQRLQVAKHRCLGQPELMHRLGQGHVGPAAPHIRAPATP